MTYPKQIECNFCGFTRKVDSSGWVEQCEGLRLKGPCRAGRYQIAHLLSREEFGLSGESNQGGPSWMSSESELVTHS